MPRFPEVSEASHESTPESVSPDRPPQLNETVCSCRCGCGCSRELEGDGNDNEDGVSTHSIDTLVASNQSGANESLPSHDGPEQPVTMEVIGIDLPFLRNNGGFDGVQAALQELLNDAEATQFEEHVMRLEDPALHWRQALRLGNYDDFPDSLRNEPRGSDEYSVMSSETRSIRCMSPGPGMGAWIEDVQIDDYHFLDAPLRLTPQRRYCRGLVASHLVMGPDKEGYSRTPSDEFGLVAFGVLGGTLVSLGYAVVVRQPTRVK